jgi:hypothetical protein
MMHPLEALLRSSAVSARFPANSRYHGVPVAVHETADHRTYVYVRRRFVPGPERFTVVAEHTLIAAERLDHLAARYLGDPELFWRLCDANNAMVPDELTETVGRRLRIVLPEGAPGAGGPSHV